MKIFFLIFLFIISFASYSKDKIDIIIVKKSERILYAIKDDKVIKKFDIALGRNPKGLHLSLWRSHSFFVDFSFLQSALA